MGEGRRRPSPSPYSPSHASSPEQATARRRERPGSMGPSGSRSSDPPPGTSRTSTARPRPRARLDQGAVASLAGPTNLWPRSPSRRRPTRHGLTQAVSRPVELLPQPVLVGEAREVGGRWGLGGRRHGQHRRPAAVDARAPPPADDAPAVPPRDLRAIRPLDHRTGGIGPTFRLCARACSLPRSIASPDILAYHRCEAGPASGAPSPAGRAGTGRPSGRMLGGGAVHRRGA